MGIYDIINILHFAWRRILTRVWYTNIFGGIGKKTTIFKPGLIVGPERIFLGERCLIRHGSRIELLHVNGVVPTLKIGNSVNIEQNVHIVCHGNISIGDDVSITGNCAIVDVSHPPDAYLRGQKIGSAIAEGGGFVEIGEGSFIGFGSTVLPNVKIGRYCVIGAGSVVSCDIPDYAIAAGIPARVLRRSIDAANHKT